MISHWYKFCTKAGAASWGRVTLHKHTWPRSSTNLIDDNARAQGLLLEGTLLKPNMVCPGMEYPGKVTGRDIAAYTIRTLQRAVPVAVPAVVFLSGGQSEVGGDAHIV